MEVAKLKAPSSEKNTYHQGRIQKDRCQIDFRDIRSKARRDKVAKEIASGTKQALKGGYVAWQWQNKVFGDAQTVHKKTGILRKTFDKLIQLKNIIIAKDEIFSREMNTFYNCNLNELSSKLYKDLDKIRTQSFKENTGLMKKLNRRNRFTY